jgi:hypothetical protein
MLFTKKGRKLLMKLTECPYCNLPGMVITVRPESDGLEVTGKCTICGYSYDSDYSPAETTDDLPGEFSRSLESGMAD